VPDERRGPGQQRHGLGHLGGRPDRGLRGAGADPDRPVAPLDAPDVRHPAEVDEVVEDREPQGEHRHQALPAGQDLRAVPVLGQQGHGLLDARRRVVVERRGLHAERPYSPPGCGGKVVSA
jgi:hypothetical protein